MAKAPTTTSNPRDYRPGSKGDAHTKPIYNAADYRSPFESSGKAGGKGGKGKSAKKPKIFHLSHRLAPGASHDPWGGSGRK
jgi:hypothetical protein